MKNYFHVFILAMFALACAAVAKGDSNGDRPDKLIASIEGFSGASYRVELGDADEAIYLYNPRTFTGSPGTIRSRIQVDLVRWKSFRKALNDAEVWKWKKEYSEPGTQDGTVWTLSVTYHDTSIETHGNNAYPDKKQFEVFRSAIVALLAGRDFK
jgi:hypothetical protein